VEVVWGWDKPEIVNMRVSGSMTLNTCLYRSTSLLYSSASSLLGRRR
jgi:hypothetical protein